MATRILEYSGSWSGGHNPPVFPSVVDVVQTVITSTGTSQQSAVFAPSTTLVVIDTDRKVHVAFGTDPTATTSFLALQAGQSREFNITGPGQRVAIIQG